jgi:hypothetical protein
MFKNSRANLTKSFLTIYNVLSQLHLQAFWIVTVEVLLFIIFYWLLIELEINEEVTCSHVGLLTTK